MLPARLTAASRHVIWLAPLLLSACGFLTTDAQRIARAKAALASGDARAAIIDFGAVHDKDPANTEAAAGLIEAQVALGDKASARREFDKIPAALRDSPALFSAKLGVLLLEGKNQEVLDAVAASTGEHTVAIDKFAARALLGLGKPAEAEAVVARALSRSAADADLIRLQALATFEAGDPDRALNTLRGARRQISDPSLGLLEAQLLLQAARPAQSEQLLLSLIEDAPAGQQKAITAMLRLALAESQIATGKFQAADTSLTQAEGVLGRTPGILLARARAKAGLGDAAGALTLIADAKEAGVPDAATICFEAPLKLGGKPLTEAVDTLQQCLAAQPQNVAVRKLLARALLESNRNKEAAEVLEPLRSNAPFDLDVLRLDLGASNAPSRDQLVQALQARLQAKGRSAQNVVAVADLMLALGEPKKALELTDLEIDWGQAARARSRIRAIATGATAPSSNSARVALTEFMQQAPDDPPTYLLASRIARQQGDLAESTRHLEDGVKRFPRSSELLLELAELRLSAGDAAGSDALLVRARAVNPGAPALALLQARIQTAQGKPDAASQTLEAAYKASPSPTLRAEVIRSRIASGAVDSATKELTEFEREGAPKFVVDELRASLLLRQGRAQEASALLAPIAAATPKDPRAQLRLGVAQLASGNAAAAIPALRKSWEQDPASLPVASLLVQALLGRNQIDEALSVARKTQASVPNKGQPFALEAAVHVKRNDLESARGALVRGNEIEPSGDLALQLYAIDSALKRKSPEAVLETAWQRSPQDLRLPLAISEAQMRAGNRKAAIATLEMARKTESPLKPAVLNNLAWWYHEAGDARARDTAEAAVRLAPKNASIVDTLGWIMVESGKLPDGLQRLREAAELDPTSPDVIEHLAEAESRSGNETQARARIKDFVAKRPETASRPGFAKFLGRESS